jgi:hypothetical protein
MIDPIRIRHVVNIWVNVVVPHGPGMGSHMAPSHHSKWQVSKFLEVHGFELTTYAQADTLGNNETPTCPTCFLLYASTIFYFTVQCIVWARKVGLGLSPSPWFSSPWYFCYSIEPGHGAWHNNPTISACGHLFRIPYIQELGAIPILVHEGLNYGPTVP